MAPFSLIGRRMEEGVAHPNLWSRLGNWVKIVTQNRVDSPTDRSGTQTPESAGERHRPEQPNSTEIRDPIIRDTVIREPAAASGATGRNSPAVESAVDPHAERHDAAATSGTKPGEQPSATEADRQTAAAVDALLRSHERLVGAIESVHEHLAAQARPSEQIARSLSKVAHGLDELPAAAKPEMELLRTLSERLASSTDVVCKVEKTVDRALEQVPVLAESHREAITAHSRQMERVQRAQEELTKTVRAFDQTLGRRIEGLQTAVDGAVDRIRGAYTELTDGQADTTAAVRELQQRSAARGERAMELLERQTGHLKLLGMTLVVLGLIGVALSVVGLIR